jgi:solute carrier family 25 2-oxodicarboxylate transporter 21
MTQSVAILTGCAAGATESFVVTPFELVKIRLQDKSTTFNGPVEVVKDVIKKNGLRGIYAGQEATMWRHIWWSEARSQHS